jgi:S-adenosylmethionine:tRNA ribosyltransferase-isomerase
MKMSEFIYNLPEERIAKFPPKERGTTKLLVLDRKEGSIKHRKYSDSVEYMKEGDIVVLNETKVEKRRTYFVDSKERIHEVLFLNQQQDGNWFCLIKKSKQLNEKDILSNLICKEIQLQIVKKSEKGVIVRLISDLNPEEVFEKIGHTPIPPYMKRDDTEEDFERYNTVFGRQFGSVASPTASLNLTEDLLEKIKKKGIKIAKVELKVGWGTFAPVREEDIEDHEIHEEEISLSQTSAGIINETIKNSCKTT